MSIVVLAVAAVACAMLCASCSSVGSAVPVAAPGITGAHSCPGDQAQDLTLTGGLTGHLTCSTAPVPCHRIHGPASPGVQLLIQARSGSKPVTVRIAFGNDHLGTFQATPIGDEPGLEQQGVTVTGIGTWSSTGGSGNLTIVVEQAPSLSQEGRVSGSVDVKLTDGAASAQVTGGWTCFKTLAGGDGWSSA